LVEALRSCVSFSIPAGSDPTKICARYIFVVNTWILSVQQRIIKGCIAGDRSAQAQLYNLYARKMLGVCSWYAHNKEEAEEILQDGFIRVFTYIHKFRGTGSFEGWMRRIMVNAALLRYRSKSSHLKPVIEFNPDSHDAADKISVIEQLETKELVNMVQRLTPAYRMVFSLFVLEGMKHREIAKLLGISEGTSKSNLSAARIILQKALIKNNLGSHYKIIC
jgi:RNA polymerase sigma factor (sigma-70 family)